MSNIKNRVQLIGHLGNDPEVLKFDSGKTKASFRMATNDRYKSAAGEWVDDTQWHNITAWGKLAERVEKAPIAKGTEVAIQGKLTHRSYDDSEGNKKYLTEINLDAFEIFTRTKEQA